MMTIFELVQATDFGPQVWLHVHSRALLFSSAILGEILVAAFTGLLNGGPRGSSRLQDILGRALT
jgi:hypothetical protein